MTKAVIAVEDVTRIYHVGDIDVHALAGVNLTVERGEFVAIMGSSGSGKSTLMSILGCLDSPTGGHYLLDGIDVAGLAEPDLAHIRSERLGFVFQSFNLLSRTSAAENVALPLLYSEGGKSSSQDRSGRAHEALQRLGLGDRAGNTPGQLSGGQQQRVAIARALINSPSLLLADEPTGNLDTRTSHEIMQTLVQLNRAEGVTIVLVTHESDIAAYADRIVTMRDGRILTDERKKSTVPETPPAGTADLSIFHPRAAPSAGDGAVISWGFSLMILAAAVQALARSKMRSALTMLGVFIGVAALIAMVAVGQGTNDAVLRQIASLGTNLVVVVPGAVTSLGARGGAGSASTLTVADAQTIRCEDPAVGALAYLIRQSGQTEYGDQNWTTTIQGVTPNYPSITNWQIAAGRGIARDDRSSAALVAVIGQTVYRQLFAPSDNPIGAVILVKSVPLRVIGVFVGKGQSSYGQDQDDLVMIPFSTAEGKVLGVAAPTQPAVTSAIFLPQPNPYGIQPRLTGFVNQIYVQASSPAQVQAAITQPRWR